MTQDDGNSVFDLRDNVQLYRVLGVPQTATDNEIKRAYYKLAIIYHPDKNPDGADTFKEISFAHGILCDPDQRRMYDSKTLRKHVEGQAREYDPMMDPNVELTPEQLRNFVENIRQSQKDTEKRRADFEHRKAEEIARQAEFDRSNPHFKMSSKMVDVSASAAVHMENFQKQQRTTADMMRALDQLHSNTACSSSSSTSNPHEVDLSALHSASNTSLKAKMLSDFRNARRENGHTTTEDLATKVSEEDTRKFGFVKAVPSYSKAVERVVKTRSNFNYTSFVTRDLVDGGALTEAILADALGDYDPNN